MGLFRKKIGPLLLGICTFVAISGCGQTLSEQEYLDNARNHWQKADYRASMIEVKNALQLNPGNMEARLLLGQIFLKFNQGAAAEKEIRVASRLGMDNTRIMKPLAHSLLLQNKYQEALDVIDLNQVSNANHQAELMVHQGQAYLGLEQVEIARQVFENALRKDSSVKGGYLGLARVATLNGQAELSEQYLDKAIRQQPDSNVPALLKAELYLSQQKTELAEKLFKELAEKEKGRNNINFGARIGLVRSLLAQKKVDQAATIADALVSEFPNLPSTNYYRALVAYQRGDYKTSQTYFQNVLRVAPDHLPSIYLMGAVSYTLKNYEQAIEYLNKFVAAEPSDLNAQKMLASTQIILDQPREAMQILTSALETNPDDPHILAMLGDVSIKEGEHDVGSKYLEKALEADPENAKIRVGLARAYLSLGKIDEGIQELQKTLEQDAQQQQAQLLLILTYFKKKDYEQALSIARKFLELNEKDPLIHNLIGGIYAAKGDLAQSRKYFENAVNLQPDFKPAMINLARMDFRDGDLKNARERYEALLSVEPDNIAVIMGLAQVLDNVGEREEALKWLEQANKTNPDAITPALVLGQHLIRKREYARALNVLGKILKLYPDNAHLLFQAGQANLGLGNYKTARSYFQKVITLQPRSTQAHIYLALTFREDGDQYQARVYLNKALKIQPANLTAARLLIQMDIKEGREKEAIQFVRQMQKEQPDSATGFVLEGDILMRGNRYLDAATAYERALTRTQSVKFVLKRADALRKAKKNDLATSILNQWLAEHPREVAVHIYLATEYHKLGELKEATRHYEKILEIKPNHVIALNNLASLYFDNKDKRALDLADQAYKISPSAVTADTLGWIKLNQGDVSNGLLLIKEAANQAPQVHEIQYHLAEAYARNGQKSAAREILETILEDSTPFTGKDKARALLKSLQG